MSPNFLIIGVQKAGTSSLHNYLSEHPEVFMSEVKEPHYFSQKTKSNNEHLVKSGKVIVDESQYLGLFDEVAGEVAVGESSPSYIYDKEAPAEIKSFNPNMKLIIVLRDPVRRAYSNFLHARRSNREPKKDFLKACALEEERISGGKSRMLHYVKKGMYAEQITHYLKYFSRDNILILLHENLLNNKEEQLRNVFDFLGVDCSKYDYLGERIFYNKSRSYNVRFAKSLRKFKPLFMRFIPVLSQKMLDTFFKPKSITQTELVKAFEYFSDDVDSLEKILGVELNHWKHTELRR